VPLTGVDVALGAAVAQARASLAEADGVRCVYLTGSFAAGLGNLASDVDLVAVTDGESTDAQWRETGSLISHLEVFPLTTVRTWLAALNELPYGIADYDRAVELGGLLENLSRVTFAQPVLGEPVLRDLQAEIDRTALRQAFMLYDGADAITHARDAYGALESGDLLTALDASQQTLRLCLLATLAAADDLYYGRKWLLRRLRECPAVSPELFAAAMAALFPASPLEFDDLGYVTDVVMTRMRLAAGLSALISLYGWAEPVKTVGPPPSGATDPRSPWYVFTRFRDTCFAGGASGLQLTRLDIAAWLSVADDRDTDRLAERLSERFGIPVSASYAAATLAKLTKAGMISDER
jgi:Nucleotidyltransferase domain